ncbi:plasmid segregation protein ParM domain-containing protein [Bacterioplanoides sp.]|uniref:plasmid segregation protein ParM domain-containing protein n=1 Tax=Bacterioplanoides sp. TaxID=2066072 RepID=UPI003B5C4AFE
MSEQIIVVDEGSAQGIGAYYCETEKKIKFCMVPAMIGLTVDTDPVGNPLDNSYEVDGDEFCVSTNLTSPVTTKRASYQTSVENRVLIHEVLRKAGFGGQEITVMCTLPITQYFMGDSYRVNKELVLAKKRNIMGDITSINDVPLARIKNSIIAPESISGFLDHVIDETGEWLIQMDEGQTALVIDIGGTTTDMSVVDSIGSPQARHSEPKGVFDIADSLRTEMIAEGLAKSLPRAHLDAVLRSGTYRGRSCRDLIKKASHTVMREILSRMQTFGDDENAFEYVIFVGGGAAIIGEELGKRYGNPNYIIPKDPDLAVARGLVKMQLANRLAAEEEAMDE